MQMLLYSVDEPCLFTFANKFVSLLSILLLLFWIFIKERADIAARPFFYLRFFLTDVTAQ
jgi:hypothetical protein